MTSIRFLGRTSDGLLIFKNLEFPSDAPQRWVTTEDLVGRHSADPLFDGRKYFVLTDIQAQAKKLFFS